MQPFSLLGLCLLAPLLGVSTVPSESELNALEAVTATTIPAPPSLAGAPSSTLIVPLEIACPEDFKAIGDSGSIDPTLTGTATAFGGCARPLTITYSDVETAHCPADRFQRDILRTWTVTDPCGNSASCTQTIHIVRQVWPLDIKPTSCPNPIQLGGGGGQVSVGILGWTGRDVTQIDPNSIRIWREDCSAGPLAPNMVTFEDVATPYVNGNCGCTTLGADGFMDMRLRFDKQQLIQAMNLGSARPMSYVRLVVTATLLNGCQIVGSDCVRVQ